MHHAELHSGSAPHGKVQPLQTAALVLSAILPCLFARNVGVGLAAAGWMSALILLWSRVPWRVLARLLAVQIPFLFLM
ncbi:MAG: hypothetical protein M1457_07180, partial [bacterium]|nr:hypothetical protein [bacterium]